MSIFFDNIIRASATPTVILLLHTHLESHVKGVEEDQDIRGASSLLHIEDTD